MSRKLMRCTGLSCVAILLLAGGACSQDRPAPTEDLFVEDGAIHFRSPEAFYAVIDAVGRMTPAELDSWEERHGFVSYRREFERVMEQVAAAPTQQASDAILAANDDIVRWTADTADSRIQAFGYTAVVNRKGIFHVEDVIHKVTPDEVISAEDGRLETIEAALAMRGERPGVVGTSVTPAAGVRIVRYAGEPRTKLDAVPYGCTDYKNAFYNTSDRKVEIEMKTYDYACTGCCGNFFHQVVAEGRLKGWKKNWLGNWSNNYSTSYDYTGVEFEIAAPIVLDYVIGPSGQLMSRFNYQDYTVSPGSGSSGSDWVTWHFGTWYVGHQVQNSDIEDPYFKKVKARGKSRGTGANGWADICCGYAGGCGTGTCKTTCYPGECGYIDNYCGGTIYCGSCGGGGGGGGGGCLPNPALTGDGTANLIEECPEP
jgi:hypothetical protein